MEAANDFDSMFASNLMRAASQARRPGPLQPMPRIEDVSLPRSFRAFGRRTLTKREQEIVGTRCLESELHYEFVPDLRPDEGLDWYWMLQTFDDVGTGYSDSNGGGARGPATTGPATHATRDSGARIPDSAARVRIAFSPPSAGCPRTMGQRNGDRSPFPIGPFSS